MGSVHVDRTLLEKHLKRVLRLVVESDIGADRFKEGKLLFRAGRGNDFATRCLS